MRLHTPGHRAQVLIAVTVSVIGLPVVLALLAGASRWILHPGGANRATAHLATGPAQYVGTAACVDCHEAEYNAWRGSQHDLAMQTADESTVLGDFNNATFEHNGVTTRFFKRDAKFMVETQGTDGKQHEYTADYTFGLYPLQQYLIGFPDGREQALTVAWDSRPADVGGQRWFDLYPDEIVPPGDELHWTAPAHNWNFACAECHSTNLRKNYDAATDTYATTWSDINVGCEACHGPGSIHVEIARAAQQDPASAYPADQGLVVTLRGPGQWRREEGATVAALATVPPGASEVETCGRCHARRTELTDDYEFGHPLSETHRVQLLTDPYYFPDGQILDEDYVYASFRQSRMYDMGVTCTDCHDPHTMKLHKTGNDMCNSCHAPEVYDVLEHHHHEVGTEGSLCIDCHMPTRTYMVVDPRRDHSMRIPRPDLTEAIGVPNACNQCHADKSPEWAVNTLHEWYGPDLKPGHQTYALAFQEARDGAPGAGDALAAIALDADVPAIARATALEELTPYCSPATLPAIEAGLKAPDPLIRRAAAEALTHADVKLRWELLSPLLDDPVRSVRLGVAAALADVRTESVDASKQAALRRAFDEYVASERFNADRAEHWVNLAGFHFRQGDVAQSEHDYAEAKRRNPRFVPIYANHADMLRELGREADAERTLRAGLEAIPDSASLHHSLGLLFVRTHRMPNAIEELRIAYTLAPESTRFGYVYGVALDSTGDHARAIGVWEDVLRDHPNDPDTLQALAISLVTAGEPGRALPYAERLAALRPDDPGATQLRDAIKQRITRSR